MSEAPAKRLCRACGDAYVFPEHRSLATRVHCQACAGLDPAVRRVLETMSRRVARLEAEVAAIRQERGGEPSLAANERE